VYPYITVTLHYLAINLYNEKQQTFHNTGMHGEAAVTATVKMQCCERKPILDAKNFDGCTVTTAILHQKCPKSKVPRFTMP